MCGRFSFAPNEKIIEERFSVKAGLDLFAPRYNCAPAQKLAVISNNAPDALSFFQWGLVPFWAKDASVGSKMINTKAETIAEKPSFKKSFISKRCLVPADGFYEWKKEDKDKTPYYIYLKNRTPFTFAGIWDEWKDAEGKSLRTFSIITTWANDLMKPIHERMPVILKQEEEKEWLSVNNPQVLLQLLRQYPSAEMELHKVSTWVNSPRNDNPDLINPI
jgi:putative SOS response-associated peptidase YedK